MICPTWSFRSDFCRYRVKRIAVYLMADNNRCKWFRCFFSRIFDLYRSYNRILNNRILCNLFSQNYFTFSHISHISNATNVFTLNWWNVNRIVNTIEFDIINCRKTALKFDLSECFGVEYVRFIPRKIMYQIWFK